MTQSVLFLPELLPMPVGLSGLSRGGRVVVLIQKGMTANGCA